VVARTSAWLVLELDFAINTGDGLTSGSGGNRLRVDRRALESVVVEFIEHYNEHRPHRSLTQRCPRSWDSDPLPIIDPQLDHLRRAKRHCDFRRPMSATQPDHQPESDLTG
jgi:hypothetical protein